jgi:hypothetical protein
MAPVQAALVTPQPNTQVVALSGRDLGGRDDGGSAIGEPRKNGRIIDLPPPSGPVCLLLDYARRRHIRAEVERSGTGGRIWR